MLPRTNQPDKQKETIHLLHRACAVAESHTNAMGIVLMSTLPILACKYLTFTITPHPNNSLTCDTALTL